MVQEVRAVSLSLKLDLSINIIDMINDTAKAGIELLNPWGAWIGSKK